MVAGFRMGRGRDSAQQQGRQPYGRPYGGRPTPPHAQQWQRPPSYGPGHGGRGRRDEPEYFGGPAPDPYADNPGHTRAFSIGDAPDGYGPDQAYGPYGDDSAPAGMYRAGRAPAPPAGPRLHWKQLLSGIVFRPNATFWQMRDHAVWGPALTVTFLYGLVAVLGFDQAREDVLNATLSNGIPLVLSTGIAVVISGLLLGAVTNTLARQLGGDGLWQPTVGLSMLIMSITDAPRLLVAVFLGGDSSPVQVLGWVTWVAAGALFTSMVSKSHDLPWPKALAASSIQLIALLAVIKLGTF